MAQCPPQLAGGGWATSTRFSATGTMMALSTRAIEERGARTVHNATSRCKAAPGRIRTHDPWFVGVLGHLSVVIEQGLATRSACYRSPLPQSVTITAQPVRARRILGESRSLRVSDKDRLRPIVLEDDGSSFADELVPASDGTCCEAASIGWGGTIVFASKRRSAQIPGHHSEPVFCLFRAVATNRVF